LVIKKNNNIRLSRLIKKLFLLSVVFISLSCFIYITILSYSYFYKKNDNEITIIKAPSDPIKIFAKYQKPKKTFDQMVYSDIFENNKNQEKTDTIISNPEPKKPPPIQKSDNNSIKEYNKKAPKKEIKKPLDIKNNDQIIIFDQEDGAKKQVNNVFESRELKDLSRKNRRKIRVQIAALTSKESADISWKKLNRLYTNLFFGLNYYVNKVDLGKRGVFYRLQVGDFFNQIRAEEFCKKYIAQSGKTSADCIIVE